MGNFHAGAPEFKVSGDSQGSLQRPEFANGILFQEQVPRIFSLGFNPVLLNGKIKGVISFLLLEAFLLWLSKAAFHFNNFSTAEFFAWEKTQRDHPLDAAFSACSSAAIGPKRVETRRE